MNLRLAEGYVPTFDIDASVGRQSELLVHDIVGSLAEGASVEVKTDEKFSDTGNVYFEYQCHYPNRGWQGSGLGKCEAEIWVHVLGVDGASLTLEFSVLKLAARRLWDAGYKKECRRGSHPTRGVCAPLLIFLSFYKTAKAELSTVAREAA